MQTVFAERVVVCQSPVEVLWSRLADTDRLNQAMGFSPISLRPIHSPSGARFRISTQLGGQDLTYDELPTEFIQQDYFTIHRDMVDGPLSSISLHFRFRPRPVAAMLKGSLIEPGSLVDIRLSAVLRDGVPALLVQPELDRQVQGIAQQVRRVDQHPEHLLELPPEVAIPLNVEALERALKRLRELLVKEGRPQADAETLVHTLSQLLQSDDPRGSFQLRPYELTAQLSPSSTGEPLSRREALELFLHAVDAGVLELVWALVCQSCRGVVSEMPSLEELEDHASCQYCELRFSTTLEDSVEAVFRPVRAIRPQPPKLFCLAGPARSPHVFCQGMVAAGSRLILPVPQEKGTFAVSARGGTRIRLELSPEAPLEHELSLERLPIDSRVQLAPGGKLSVVTETPEARHVRIERSEWVRQAATVRELCLLPHFRRTFSQQLLRPGLTLRVGRMTVLFSDLSNSTLLYQQVGDAAAFRFVYDHFTVLESCILAHQGVLIKTSGDAVMAVFEQEMQGLKAALSMLEQFKVFRDRYTQSHPECAIVHLKLGLNAGTCYLVSDRARLDYFGQIVNVAARLQSEAQQGELVVSEALAKEGLERGVLKPTQLGEHYFARLKGVEPAVPAVRIRPESEASPAA